MCWSHKNEKALTLILFRCGRQAHVLEVLGHHLPGPLPNELRGPAETQDGEDHPGQDVTGEMMHVLGAQVGDLDICTVCTVLYVSASTRKKAYAYGPRRHGDCSHLVGYQTAVPALFRRGVVVQGIIIVARHPAHNHWISSEKN